MTLKSLFLSLLLICCMFLGCSDSSGQSEKEPDIIVAGEDEQPSPVVDPEVAPEVTPEVEPVVKEKILIIVVENNEFNNE